MKKTQREGVPHPLCTVFCDLCSPFHIDEITLLCSLSPEKHSWSQDWGRPLTVKAHPLALEHLGKMSPFTRHP